MQKSYAFERKWRTLVIVAAKKFPAIRYDLKMTSPIHPLSIAILFYDYGRDDCRHLHKTVLVFLHVSLVGEVGKICG